MDVVRFFMAGSFIGVFLTSIVLAQVLFNKNRIIYAIIFTLIILVMGYINYRIHNRLLHNTFYFILGFMLILLGIFIFFNIIYLIGKSINKEVSYNILGRAVPFLLSLLVAFYGVISAYTIRVTPYDVTLPKKQGTMDSLKIAVISDIHLGNGLGPEFLKKLVDKVNWENPEVVLIAGDLLDIGINGIKKEDEDKIREELKKLKGDVYFVMGNHDYFGNTEETLRFINSLPFNVLIDEKVNYKNAFNILGVDELSKRSFNVTKDDNLPLVILTHTPVSNPSFKNGDLVISGHTHNGQIFPAQILVRRLFKNAYGLKEMNGYQSLVSSGAGFWGFPMRIFTKSEVVTIEIKFKH